MALNCNCPSSYSHSECSWRTAVLSGICQMLTKLAEILAAVGGGGPTGFATEVTLQGLDAKITKCDTDDVTITSMPAISVGTAYWALRLDEGATYTYVGEAVPGTLDAAATWRIKRITNADGTIVWADGNSSSDNIWTARAGLAYS